MNLISKGKAVDLLKHEADTHCLPEYKEAYIRAASIIACMPNEEAEPVKHGTWTVKEHSRMKLIPEKSDGITEDVIEVEDMTEQKCSICQRWTIKFTHHIELNFCPYCGARMDGDNT